jgi:hypothetical protein
MKRRQQRRAMGKPDLEELQYLFLKNLCEYAPKIIVDLFRRKDQIEWAKHWGLESDWIIENAVYALELRIGNTLLQAWLKAIQGIRYEFKPPPLEIEIFAEDETFHYLPREEFDRRFKKEADKYYDQFFSDEGWFDQIDVREHERFIKWLVLKISGLTDDRIAEIENHGIDESTIRKGRLKMAKELNLKKKERGRPRKSK